MQKECEASQRQAYRVTQRPRSTQRYHPQIKQDEPALIQRRHELVRRHPRFGYRRIWAMLRAEGRRVNRKRVRRLWKLEGFRVPQKTHKKRLWGHSDNGILRHRAWHKEDVWTWDFLHDSDEAGRLRDELLNLEVFANLAEAKALAAPWQQEYNHVR